MQAVYSEYLDARLKAIQMSNEYIASSWLYWRASEVNDAEKCLSVRLAEFEQRKKPENVQKYMDEMKTETSNATEIWANKEKSLGRAENAMQDTPLACMIIAGGGLMAVNPYLAPALWKMTIPWYCATATLIPVVPLGKHCRDELIRRAAKSPAVNQQEKINEAIALIENTPEFDCHFDSIYLVNTEGWWGYAPTYGNDIFLSSRLLTLSKEDIASAIVHESVHRNQSVFIPYISEISPYQSQSDFLRAVGVTGKIAKPGRVAWIGEVQRKGGFSEDLAIEFWSHFIINPAIWE